MKEKDERIQQAVKAIESEHKVVNGVRIPIIKEDNNGKDKGKKK